jgi:tyrosine phenol-lyase
VKTLFEPFRIKVVEPIRVTTEQQRLKIAQKADFNLFQIKAEDIIIDFLTDSGTSAMSDEQWAGMMRGDESYAGARSYYRFEKVVKDLTGYNYVLPVHQGRAAERILFGLLADPSKLIPSNTHFDTTRANIEFKGAQAVDLVIEEGKDPASTHPFKGNLDTVKLRSFIEETGKEHIPVCMLTVTNNSGGGQPVSMANVREVKAVLADFGIPLFLDACRFAENAYFIKHREEGYADKSCFDIAKEMFSLADGCTMSAKKDALVNMGGFLALNDEQLAQQARNDSIVTEGFPTYGGLAGRDLEAIAQGLKEILNEDYLKYRIRTAEYFGEKLDEMSVQYVKPAGGHAIYLDAKAILPHIPPEEFPGQALAIALYLKGGIRSCEIGGIMFGKKDPTTGEHIAPALELVRLAFPRRVYTQSHIDYSLEVIEEVAKEASSLKGVKITWEPQFLRHFTGKFARLK